jgi:hypothetical protein
MSTVSEFGPLPYHKTMRRPPVRLNYLVDIFYGNIVTRTEERLSRKPPGCRFSETQQVCLHTEEWRFVILLIVSLIAPGHG